MFGDAVDKLFVLIGAKSSMADDLRKPEKDIEDFENKVERSGTDMDRHYGRVFANIAKAAAVGFAAMGTGIVLLGKGMLEGAGQVERYSAILETVTGSAETATEKLEWLRDFAQKTPFELSGLMEAATKLEAYGFAAEDYMGVLGDTAAALGKDVNDAVEALADATMGEFERLKEFGIKATTEGSQIAFNYVDKNGQQQKALVDKNNQEMIASTLSAIWNERYGGAMEKMSQTWEGMVSNLKDAWSAGLADIGSTIMPIMKPYLEDLIEFVGGDSFKGALSEVAIAFADIASAGMEAFESLSPLLADVARLVGDIAEEFSPVISEIISRISDIFGEVMDQIESSGLIDALAELAGILAEGLLDTLESIVPLAVPLLDLFVSILTPIAELAVNAGLFQIALGAIVAIKLASWASDAIGGIMKLAKGIGDAATGAASLGNMFVAGGALIVGVAYWASTMETTGEEVEGTLDNIEAAWEDLTRTERRETLAQLEIFQEQMAALGWLNDEEMADLDERINHMRGALETNIEDVNAYYEDHKKYMDLVAEGTEIDLQQMEDNFKTHGANMVAEGGNIPKTILEEFEGASPEILQTLGWMLDGAIGKIRETVDMTDEEAKEFGKVLTEYVAKVGGDLGTLSEADYQAIASLTGLTVGEVKSAIATMVEGAGPAMSEVSSITRTEIGGLQAWLDGHPLYIRRIVQSIGEDVADTLIPHKGGLIMHGGGIATIRAHSGYLAPNEVPAILERGEHVTRATSVNARTLPVLQTINATGKVPGGAIFNITNLNLPGVRDPQQFEAWAVRKTQEAAMMEATH
ncbi:MAG: tape measure protein [bacterium]